jgi:hypothetical protein
MTTDLIDNLNDSNEYGIVWWGQSNARPWGDRDLEGFEAAPWLRQSARGQAIMITAINGTVISVADSLDVKYWKGGKVRLIAQEWGLSQFTAHVGVGTVTDNDASTLTVTWDEPQSVASFPIAAYVVLEDKWETYPNVRVLMPYQPEEPGPYATPTTTPITEAAMTFPAGVTSYADVGLFREFCWDEGLEGVGFVASGTFSTAHGDNHMHVLATSAGEPWQSQPKLLVGATLTARATGEPEVFGVYRVTAAALENSNTDIALTITPISGVLPGNGDTFEVEVWVPHWRDSANAELRGWRYPANDMMPGGYNKFSTGNTYNRPDDRLSTSYKGCTIDEAKVRQPITGSGIAQHKSINGAELSAIRATTQAGEVLRVQRWATVGHDVWTDGVVDNIANDRVDFHTIMAPGHMASISLWPTVYASATKQDIGFTYRVQHVNRKEAGANTLVMRATVGTDQPIVVDCGELAFASSTASYPFVLSGLSSAIVGKAAGSAFNITNTTPVRLNEEQKIEVWDGSAWQDWTADTAKLEQTVAYQPALQISELAVPDSGTLKYLEVAGNWTQVDGSRTADYPLPLALLQQLEATAAFESVGAGAKFRLTTVVSGGTDHLVLADANGAVITQTTFATGFLPYREPSYVDLVPWSDSLLAGNNPPALATMGAILPLSGPDTRVVRTTHQVHHRFGCMVAAAQTLANKINRRVNVIILGINSSSIYGANTNNQFAFQGELGWWDDDKYLSWTPSLPDANAARLKHMLEVVAPAALEVEAAGGTPKPLKILGIVGFQGEAESLTEVRNTYADTLPAFYDWLRDVINDAGMNPYSSAKHIPAVHASLPTIPWEVAGNFYGVELSGDTEGVVNAAIAKLANTDTFASTFDTNASPHMGDDGQLDLYWFPAGVDPLHFNGYGEVRNADLVLSQMLPLITQAFGAAVADLDVASVTATGTENSYCTLAQADSYHDAMGHPAAWFDATVEAKQEALRRASQFLDLKFGTLWMGVRATATQLLDWPRTGAVDRDGRAIVGVPVRIVQATCEMALRHVQSPSTAFLQDVAAGSGTVTSDSVTIGPLSTSKSYSSTPSLQTEYEIVRRMLQTAGLIPMGNQIWRN